MSNCADYLLPEWQDEKRMRVMFGPMPSLNDNVARNARLTFWSAAIHQWCRIRLKLIFTLQECQSVFRRGTQNPLCLPDVLLHLNSLGEVIPLDQLPSGEQGRESWVYWGYRLLVARPLNFSWNKLKQAIGFDNLQGATFVNTLVLQEMCQHIYQTCIGLQSNNTPLSLAELYAHVGESVGFTDNLYLIVQTLANRGQAVITVHNGTSYVKFAMPGDTRKPSITPAELAEKDLQCAQQQVEDNIAELSEKTANLRLEAKHALNSGSRTQALSMLKRKKRLEKSLATQLGALENVTCCIHQLKESQINKQVVEAFREGAEALHAAVSGDTSPENVSATMDVIQQVLDECQDVSSMLAAGIKSPEVEDDEDTLLSELNQLLEQDQQHADKEADLCLPDIPKTNPLASFSLSAGEISEKYS